MGAILLEKGGEVEEGEGFLVRGEGRREIWGVIERVGILGVFKIDGRASRPGVSLRISVAVSLIKIL